MKSARLVAMSELYETLTHYGLLNDYDIFLHFLYEKGYGMPIESDPIYQLKESLDRDLEKNSLLTNSVLKVLIGKLDIFSFNFFDELGHQWNPSTTSFYEFFLGRSINKKTKIKQSELDLCQLKKDSKYFWAEARPAILH